jgi:hypothetical protein
MRKRMKLKKRSCAMCKPHKMGWNQRWKIKDLRDLRIAEQEIRNVRSA